LSIKDERAIKKSETEVVGKSAMPSAPIDRPSLVVEVHNGPSTRTKDETNQDDKKMPAIESNKPSQSAKTENNDQRGDGVIQDTTTVVTNSPSGLDVIANAAANADDVHVHPGEIIVIDDVPEVRAVSISSIDASVYSFLGAKEFYVPFEETMNKTLSAKQRIQENVSQQRKLLKTYNKSFDNGLMEMPLLHLQNWFFGL
jgi:hypothetical protein